VLLLGDAFLIRGSSHQQNRRAGVLAADRRSRNVSTASVLADLQISVVVQSLAQPAVRRAGRRGVFDVG